MKTLESEEAGRQTVSWHNLQLKQGSCMMHDGLICYVCGWAQGFKLAYSTPPDTANSVYLAEWLCMQFYLIHSAQGCWFNPRSSKLFFPAASRPDHKHWIRLVSCYVHCHWVPCGHNNQPIRFKMGLIWVLHPQFTTLLSSIHSVAPIVLLTLTKNFNNWKILFLILVIFSLASGLYFP